MDVKQLDFNLYIHTYPHTHTYTHTPEIYAPITFSQLTAGRTPWPLAGTGRSYKDRSSSYAGRRVWLSARRNDYITGTVSVYTLYEMSPLVSLWQVTCHGSWCPSAATRGTWLVQGSWRVTRRVKCHVVATVRDCAWRDISRDTSVTPGWHLGDSPRACFTRRHSIEDCSFQYIYIYTHTHTHTYIYTHTNTHTEKLFIPTTSTDRPLLYSKRIFK